MGENFGLFKSFGDRLFEGETPTNLGLIGSFIALDSDVTAYFARVTAAGGVLNATEQTAITNLVAELKDLALWNSLKAIYPMVGASAAACAQNLKSASFTGTFTSGWTFTINGVTPNGSSAYFNTNCNDNNFVSNLSSLGVYSRTDTAPTGYDMGIYNTSAGNGTWLRIKNPGFGGGVQQAPPEVNAVNLDSRGFFQMSKNGNTTVLGYKNGSQVINTLAATTAATNTTSFLGTLNNNGSPAFGFSTNQYAFAYLGDGLSATDMVNLYTTVQSFQTTLSRQV